jgi:hypothetical protein
VTALTVIRAVPTVIAQAIRDRDEGRCSSCGRELVGTVTRQWAVWKRIPMLPNGTETDPRVCAPANLVAVCGYNSGCHRLLRREPVPARRRGFRLWREEDPRELPVLVWTGASRGSLRLATYVAPFLLDDDGRRSITTFGSLR